MRTGLSLLEVLIGSVVLVLALIPAIALLSTSSGEVVKVRDRVLGIQLAHSVSESILAQRAAARADLAPTKANQMAHLQPIIAAHNAAHPETAAAFTRSFGGFSCQAQLAGGPPADSGRVEVSWTEAGTPRSHALEVKLAPQ